MGLRGIFEGVWWVAILRAFNVRSRVVVSLVVAINEHRTWFANTNSASHGTRGRNRAITKSGRTTLAAQSSFSVYNRNCLARWTSPDEFSEKQAQGRPRA